MVTQELISAPDWRCIDFISDLHLHAAEPETFTAWESYLLRTTADAVFILGDLFEVWVGDDCLLPGTFEQRCVDVLKQASSRMAMYVMHGNRDFLLGPDFMLAGGCRQLQDPTVLVLGSERWLLTHGDHLCLADTSYQEFRTLVRSPEWQRDFLSKSLSERLAIAKGIRGQSEERKQSTTDYADVDTDAAVSLMKESATRTMIHGHTHRPFTHTLPSNGRRIVLSDWDLRPPRPRAEVLRLQRGRTKHWTAQRLAPNLTSKSVD